MSFLARSSRTLTPAISNIRMYGAGKGDKAGAIREAGGAFGKMEAAKEDQYFYNKQKEQLAELKKHLNKEIGFHEAQIKAHQDAINRHQGKLETIDQSNK